MATKLFVGNLSWKATNDDLRQKFETYGEVTDAVIIMERDNPGRSRGFGFVEFAEDADAQAAIEGLHEEEFMGRNMLVNEARPREEF
jgi:RNA recognition motif-containing protein